MKAILEPNYFVNVHALAGAVSYEMHELQPRGLLITVNNVIDIAIVERLRSEPWPPPPPRDYDHWESPEEAAEYLFEVSSVTIAPRDTNETQIKHSTNEVGLEQTAFFLPQEEFERLRDDAHAVLRTPRPRGAPSEHRLEELRNRPLGQFLATKLKYATLGAYSRDKLCLDKTDHRG